MDHDDYSVYERHRLIGRSRCRDSNYSVRHNNSNSFLERSGSHDSYNAGSAGQCDGLFDI